MEIESKTKTGICSEQFTPEEKSTYRSPIIPRVTLQGDIEDITTFQDCNIEVVNTRFFIQTGEQSCFFVHYWNCVSIGTTETGLFIMASDVIKNERFDRNPSLYDQQPALSKDETFENIKKQKPVVELLGEYTIEIEINDDQLKKIIFGKINNMSKVCPDPQEYLELIGDNEPDLIGSGLQQSDFGEMTGWESLMAKQKNGLGKREQVEVYDLQAELKKLNIEENKEMDLED